MPPGIRASGHRRARNRRVPSWAKTRIPYSADDRLGPVRASFRHSPTAAVRGLLRWSGRAGEEFGGGLAGHRFWRPGGGMPTGELVPEQAQPAAAAAARAAMGVAA